MKKENFSKLSDSKKREFLLKMRGRLLASGARPYHKNENGFPFSHIMPSLAYDPKNRFEPYPLTDIQEAFLVGREMNTEDRVGSHIYLEFETIDLEVERLNRAWERLIAHHDMLRAIINPDGSQQCLQEIPPYSIHLIDLKGTNKHDTTSTLNAIRARMSHKVYRPGRWPFFEVCVTTYNANRFRVHFSIDEVLIDAFSLFLLLRQWRQLYEDPESELPKPTISFRDFVLATKRFERSSSYQRHLSYWFDKLDHMPFVESWSWHGKRKKPIGQPCFSRQRQNGILEEKYWTRLKDKAKGLGVSPTTILFTVFSRVLSQGINEQRFPITLTLFNRTSTNGQIDNMVGPLISTMVFIAESKDSETLEESVRSCQQRLWESLDHSHVSGVRVLRELKNRKKLKSTFSIPIVFTSMIHNVDRDRKNKTEPKSWFDGVSYFITQTPQVYLDHQVFEQDGALHFNWDVVNEFFSPGLVSEMFGMYDALLLRLSIDEGRWQSPSWFDEIMNQHRQTTKCTESTLNPNQTTGIPGKKIDSYSPLHGNFADELTPDHNLNQRYQPFPLTDLQKAYFVGRSSFFQNNHRDGFIYQEFEVDDLDIGRLQRAWNKLIDVHDMLRAVVREDGTHQILREVPDYEVKQFDWRNEKNGNAEQKLEDLRAKILDRQYPIGEWPFFELSVSTIKSNQARIHIKIDFLIAAGNSIFLLFKQLINFYEHPDIPPSAPPLSFRDYMQALTRYTESDKANASIDYWKRKFAGIPGGPRLPMIERSSGHEKLSRGQFRGSLPNWTVIKGKAAELGVDPGMVLVTAFSEVISAWSEYKPFTLVVVGWDRIPLHPGIDQIVGDFTTLSWLIIEGSKNSFADKVKHHSKIVLEDKFHRAVSGLRILRKTSTGNNKKNGFFHFPVVFTDLIPHADCCNIPSQIKPGHSLSQTPQVYLDNVNFERESSLHFCWDVVETLYPSGMLGEMFSGYNRLLNHLGSNPRGWDRTDFHEIIRPRPQKYRKNSMTQISSQLPTEGASVGVGSRRFELHAAVGIWNQTDVDYPSGQCLHQFIEEQVRRTPYQIAVYFEGEKLTFADLNVRSNRYAHHLQQLGVGPDQVVGILMDRSCELMIALLAVLKAGGAYLPLDPSYPNERLEFMIENAGVSIVLTQERFANTAPRFKGTRLYLDTGSPAIKSKSMDNPDCTAQPHHLAYVLYTSGSTGQPKGCMISHEAICNRLFWMQQKYNLDEQDRVLQKTPFTFDVSVWELFWPLLTGASVILPKPGGHRDCYYLVEYIRQQQVTICHFVPSMLSLFLQEPQVDRCTSLRQIFSSGEALPYPLMKKCMETLKAKLSNLYGPTEAAVDVTYWDCHERSDQKVPIGRPIANTQIYILDPEMKPLPLEVSGEIYIGGKGLARGYLNNPKLTSEKFVNNPFASKVDSRLYKTGDQARYLPDGNIEFLGRMDSQVKIRGFRIELGEIETALIQHPGVDEAIVMLRDEVSPNPKLVAYIKYQKFESASLASIRDFLSSKLPDYMMPSVVVPMKSFPLTSHGKRDRTVLPWPVDIKSPDVTYEARDSADGIVHSISSFFAETLDIPEIDPGLDLFELGATSLTMVRVAQRIHKAYDLRIPIEAFLSNPSVNTLAQFIKNQPSGGAVAGEADSDDIPVSPKVEEKISGPSNVDFFSEEQRESFKQKALNLRKSSRHETRIFLEDHKFEASDYLRRSSHVSFLRKPVPFRSFSQFLSLLKQVLIQGHPKYLYPSAGKTYAVQTYIHVKNKTIEGLAEGIYYYHPVEHDLRLINANPSLDRSSHFYYNRSHYDSSAFGIFFIVQLDAIEPIYGEMSTHFAALEAGYMGQLLMLKQAEFNLGLCPMGGVDFEKIRSDFKLDQGHVFIHCMLGGFMEYPLRAKHNEHLQKKTVRYTGQIKQEPTSAEKVSFLIPKKRPLEIAIVGLSGRYPAAKDIREFWKNLRSGKRCITELPSSRWKSQWEDEDGEITQKNRKIQAGFLPKITEFDNLFFHIAPEEARSMDPEERLFLEVVWECIENAGYKPGGLRQVAGNVGVFVGTMWSDYQNLRIEKWHRDQISSGVSLHSAIANRISHFYNFNGPSIAVDTSCASSLTAIHLACNEIQSGACDAAVVGGANLIGHAYHQQVLADLGLLSQDNKSCAFSAAGSGLVVGEGVGAILLKPLAAAEADGDHIHGILRGTAIAHTGKTSRYGTPDANAQADSISKVLAHADVPPSSIGYIESAATGSSVSDASEMAALMKVFKDQEPSGLSRCYGVGSVKPNIGHLEAASGMSQLTKVLCQMQYQQLAPTIDSEPQNPLIQLEGSPFYIVRELQSWKPAIAADGEPYPLRALINAFGTAGSSAHLIVEQYCRKTFIQEFPSSPVVIVLSASTNSQLRESAKRLYDYLADLRANHNELPAELLSDIGYTLQSGRQEMKERLAIVADSIGDLIEKLEIFLDQTSRSHDAIFRGKVTESAVGGSPWTPEKNHSAIAENWVAGALVDWSSIWPAYPKRVPLPTYPFNRQVHSVSRPVKMSTQSTESSDSSQTIWGSQELKSPDILKKTEEFLLKVFSEESEIPTTEIRAKEFLEVYGLNSLLITRLNKRLGNLFPDLPHTLFFEFQTLHDVAVYLLETHRQSLEELFRSIDPLSAPIGRGEESPAIVRRKSGIESFARLRGQLPGCQKIENAIAIIGLSGRYPQAKNLEEFWENLKSGKDCVTEIPRDRWRGLAEYTTEFGKNGERFRKFGGFIDGVDEFDPLFFNVSPKEAESMDPQERLFLEIVWEALEDAGYAKSELSRKFDGQVAVFVGVMYGEYQLYGVQESMKGHPIALNSIYGSIANRVSHVFDFHGPSLALDTMCSSSLTGLHLAVKSLQRDECKAAVVGGVNLCLHPNKYLLHSQLNMTSRNGRCRSFGENGDGFVPGEGVGAIILKPLDAAQQDRDSIYAVVKGTAINHDGRTNGYTVPNPQAQAALVRAALENSNVDARTISYLEAHGTGTALGDPIEIAGLTKAYSYFSSDRQFCSIGSIKSNIGHLEAAAGIAGLTKVILQMKHRQLIPSLHSESLNPRINILDSPFYVQQELQEWKRPIIREGMGETEYPLRAGISSFGAGGANAHVILEEYENQLTVDGYRSSINDPVLIVLSAKNEDRLKEVVKKLYRYLTVNREPGTLNSSDLAYSLQVGREPMEERLAILASDLNELTEKLMLYSRGECHLTNVWVGNIRTGKSNLDIRVDTDLGDETLKNIIERGEFKKLARHWVAGGEVRWGNLYQNLPQSLMPRRISLPTYPFLRERYWIPQAATEKTNIIPQIATSSNHTVTRYYKRVWEKSELNGCSQNASMGPALLFVIHAPQFGSRLENEFSQTVLVQPGIRFLKRSDRLYEINPEDPKDYARLWAELEHHNWLPKTILYLWSIRSGCVSMDSDKSLAMGILSIFYLVRAFPASMRKSRIRLLFAYSGQLVGPEVKTDPYQEAVAGFSKSLTMAFPHLSSIVIQVVATGNEQTCLEDPENWLIRELANWQDHETREVRYVRDQRYVLKTKLIGLNQNEHSLFRSKGVYMITGGRGALGMAIARYLAERYTANLVLIGRTPSDQLGVNHIEDLEQWGAKVMYLPADVSDRKAMERVMARVRNTFGPLSGVIHAAGILDAASIFEKSIDDFTSNLRAKTQGTRVLDGVTREEPLDFFVMFSSISSVLGDFGQCDYAIGNRFLDSYVSVRERFRRQHKRRGRTISINWPNWEEGGMHFGKSGNLPGLQPSGMSSLKTDEGLATFEKILSNNYQQVLVGSGDPEKLDVIFLDDTRPSTVPNKQFAYDQKMVVKRRLEHDLQKIASNIIKLKDPERLDVHESLGLFGFDSISLKILADQLGETFDVHISPAVFFAHSNIHALGKYLLDVYYNELHTFYQNSSQNAISERVLGHKKPCQIRSLSYSASDGRRCKDLAIIGMDGIFPGSKNLEVFWQNLASERDLITEVPKDRWDWRAYFGDPTMDNSKTNSKWGGFIERVDEFDAQFFSIAPIEAEMMDPQHRLFLQTVWKTVEDAGYKASELAGESVGLFVGVQFNDYEKLLSGSDLSRARMATGNTHALLANRVSFLLDLHGPSEAIDTACSSSLTAVHRAVQSLRSGETDLAIAGGVSLMMSTDTFISASALGVLSPDGKCKTFANGADGYVRGEGVGAILLKPCNKAITDGDHIYAIIKGSATNHGGKAHSLTAPNSNAQAAVLIRAYEDAEVDPRTIGYIEAHGTGTELGDPVEIEGLKHAFNELFKKWNHSVPSTPTCGLGSVKTNIGHLEPASGIAGMIKVILAMQKKMIPGTLHLTDLNPHIKLTDSPFYVIKGTQDWDQPKDEKEQAHPRVAGVSSFGFGGTNVHVVLEEYIDGKNIEEKRHSIDDTGPYLIVLSTKNEDRLKEYAQNLYDFLKNRITNHPPSSINLSELAYTLQAGREAMETRLGFVATNTHQILGSLEQFLRGKSGTDRVSTGKITSDVQPQSDLDRDALQDLIRNRKFDEIVNLWLKGVDIPWQSLYGQGVRRISLPTYPFRRRRHWFNLHQNQPETRGATSLDPLSRCMLSTRIESKPVKCSTTKEVSLRLIDEHIALLTMEDRANKNMFTQRIVEKLDAAFSQICSHDQIKAIIVTGYDNVFSMGGTREGLITISEKKAQFTDMPFLYKGFLECEIPVIAAIQGHASGGGLLFGLYADIVVMSEDGIYSSNFMKFGFTPGMGATFILKDKLGQNLATEMMLTAGSFLGKELKERGASVIFKKNSDVLRCAIELAKSLAEKPLHSLKTLKKELASRILHQLPDVIHSELSMHRETFSNPEVQDRLRYYFPKSGDPTTEDISTPLGKGAPAKSNQKIIATVPGSHSTEKKAGVDIKADDKTQNQAEEGFRATITAILSDKLHVARDEINPDMSFKDLGVDSIGGIEIIRDVNKRFRLNLDAATLYDYTTVTRLAGYIVEKRSELDSLIASSKREDYTASQRSSGATIRNVTKISLKEVGAKNQIKEIRAEGQRSREEKRHRVNSMKTDTVAVIGMSARFPGASNVNKFWENLSQGKCTVTEVPSSRWSITEYYDPDRNKPNKSYSKWGGFVDGIDEFDPLFFNLSPVEARQMDPQQRLFLEEAWKALEDAGYSSTKLWGARCGVFVGVSQGHYGQLLKQAGFHPSAHSFMGENCSILAARIAYHLNLTGPSMAIDTACSSSLVAIHQGCQSLDRGESDLILAGGVSVLVTSMMHIMTSKAGMLSSDGQCRAFDTAANGFAPSEGVGVVVLKPLEKAITDGDHIYGVIKASGINQDGATNGITAPSAASQQALEQNVYERYNINPESISYVEAHGTGTKLGDPVEWKALSHSFRQYTKKKQYCAIGSVKTNIGHALAAAGIAGMIKVLLCLIHKKLVPTLHFEDDNEHIAFESSPFYVNTTCKDWKVDAGTTRRAAVSSFGFSGTNAHVILEEYMDSAERAEGRGKSLKSHYLLTVSAETEEALQQRIADLLEWLSKKGQQHTLEEISYTLNVGRSHLGHRYAAVASSVAEFEQDLKRSRNTTELYHAPSEPEASTRTKQKTNSEGTVTSVLKELSTQKLEEALYRKKLIALGDLYVKGNDVDWEILHAGEVRQRISLPTYPFMKERYWATKNEEIQGPYRSGSTDEERTLYFLNSKIEVSENQDEWNYTLSPATTLLLKQHTVFGCYVLPTDTLIEMIYVGAQEYLQSKTLCLSQTFILSPVFGREGQSTYTKQRFVLDADGAVFRISSYLGDSEKKKTKNIEGRVSVHEEPMSKNTSCNDVVRDPESITIEGVALYPPDYPLQVGPFYQCIQSIKIRGNVAVGFLSLSREARQYVGKFLLHPGILDGLLGVVVATARHATHADDTETFIPCYFERLMVYKEIENDSYTVMTKLVKMTSEFLRFDVELIDENDNVVMKLTGLDEKKVRSQDIHHQLGRYIPVSTEPRTKKWMLKNLKTDIQPKKTGSSKTKVPLMPIISSTKEEVVPNKTEASVTPEQSIEQLKIALKKLLSETLMLETSRISEEKSFMEQGVDSILGMEYVQRINRVYGCKLKGTILYERSTLPELVNFLIISKNVEFRKPKKSKDSPPDTKEVLSQPSHQLHPRDDRLLEQKSLLVGSREPFAQEKGPSIEMGRPDSGKDDYDEIAIIGMAGRFPGSETLEELWKHIEQGDYLITEVPLTHWDYRPYHTSKKNDSGDLRIYCNRGGFITDVDKFDPDFFNISPRESESMDPQLRLFLQVVWATVEDAGYAQHIKGSNTGLYLGNCYNDYLDRLKEQDQIDYHYLGTGNSNSTLSNRVSYFLDLKGPSMTLDTACSSSLVALDLACRALRDNVCEQALVGGVNLSLSPAKYLSFCAMKAFSLSGSLNPFDEKADGYLPGEGIAALLLKSLKSALRDGDNIHGVIKGSSVNFGGKSPGPTVPSSNQETAVLLKGWRESRINPESITYFEAHGTGTKLGDPLEINAIKRAFDQFTQKHHFCAIGTIKANIGHTEATAGLAGVIKVLLQMKHQMIPRLPRLKKINSMIEVEDSALYFNKNNEKWERKNGFPRRGVVSSFGMGGTYAHVVLEEPSSVSSERREGRKPFYLVCLSAKTDEGLKRQVENVLKWLNEREQQEDLVHIAYTLNCGRSHFKQRCALIVKTVAELVETLEQVTTSEIPKNCWLKKGNPGSAKNKAIYQQALEGVLKEFLTTDFQDAEKYREKLTALAQLYVLGFEVDWATIHRGDEPHRVSLPTYPFRKKRCWFPQNDGKSPKPIEPIQPSSDEVRLLYKTWIERSITPSDQIKSEQVLILTTKFTQAVARNLKKRFRDAWLISSPTAKGWPDEKTRLRFQSTSGCIDLTGLDKDYQDKEWTTILILKFLIECSTSKPLKLMYVSRNCERLRNEKTSLPPAEKIGLYRMLQSEYNNVWSRHIDLDTECSEGSAALESLVSNLLSEWQLPQPEAACCYRQNQRFIPYLQADTPGELLPRDPLVSDKHVLWVTGGTRGIGYLCAKHCVEHYGVKKLVLHGKTSLPDKRQWAQCIKDRRLKKDVREKIMNLQSLVDQGIEIEVIDTSLSDLDNLQETVTRVSDTLGAVGAVIHAAGSVEFRNPAFIRKTPNTFRKILEPKVTGLNNLHRVLEDQPISTFIVFSSIAAVLPSLATGQSDYATANTYMDYWVVHHHQQRPNTRYLSIQWPQWEETGIGKNQKRSANYVATGIGAISNNQGLHLLDRVLQQKKHSVILPAYISNDFDPGSLLYSRNEATRPRSKRTNSAPDIAPVSSMDEELLTQTIHWLKRHFSIELKIAIPEMNENKLFSEMGIDSIIVAQIVKRLEGDIPDFSINPTIIVQYPNLRRLGEALLEQNHETLTEYFSLQRFSSTTSFSNQPIHDFPKRPALESENDAAHKIIAKPKYPSTRKDKIAVIGMACHFPDAPDIRTFWQNLSSGKNSITEVPAARWDIDKHFSSNPKQKGKSISKWGAFLDYIEYFDPKYFGISKEMAPQIDPLERQWLEVSAELLADAGYSHERISERKVGVYVGSRVGNFATKFNLDEQHKDVIVGIGQNFISAHLAHIHNLTGPNMVVDTACSSSLTAVHLAVQSLLIGESELAIAGGVDILLDEVPYITLSNAQLLSSDGCCKTFDESADGIGLGEGCGALLLKPLSQAINDQDKIYGVIEGSAVNNDGMTMGITTPNPKAQETLIKETLKKAEVDPRTLTYVEAHGTGTLIGDPIELQALAHVLNGTNTDKQFCGVGSVKSNLGHLLSAAGIAGVMKVILAIIHRQLPPTLHCKNPNPRFKFEDSPVYPVQYLQNWLGHEGIHRAGVSSFGLGGNNAHILVSDEGIPDHLIASMEPKIDPPIFNKQYYWPTSNQNSPGTKDVDPQLAERITNDDNELDFLCASVVPGVMPNTAEIP